MTTFSATPRAAAGVPQFMSPDPTATWQLIPSSELVLASSAVGGPARLLHAEPRRSVPAKTTDDNRFILVPPRVPARWQMPLRAVRSMSAGTRVGQRARHHAR